MVGGGRTVERLRRARRALVDRRLLGDDEVDRLVAVGELEEASTELEVEHAPIAGDAERGNSTAATISAAFGPWACTVSGETPAAAAIFASVVRAYPSSANSSAAAATTCSLVRSAWSWRSSDR